MVSSRVDSFSTSALVSDRTYHFVQYHFVHTILSVPFCPYHFVRYHFALGTHWCGAHSLRPRRRPIATRKASLARHRPQDEIGIHEREDTATSLALLHGSEYALQTSALSCSISGLSQALCLVRACAFCGSACSHCHQREKGFLDCGYLCLECFPLLPPFSASGPFQFFL